MVVLPPPAPMARNPSPMMTGPANPSAAQLSAAYAAFHGGAKAPGAAAPKPLPPLGLPSGLQGAYAAQQDSANNIYQHGLIQSNASEAMAKQGYVQQFRDLATQFAKQRGQLPFSYNSHGMLGSGVYTQGLSDLADMNARNYGVLRTNEANQIAGFNTSRQNLLDQQQQQLAAIESQRQAAIESLGMGSIK